MSHFRQNLLTVCRYRSWQEQEEKNNYNVLFYSSLVLHDCESNGSREWALFEISLLKEIDEYSLNNS